jgi:hypothetical protein
VAIVVSQNFSLLCRVQVANRGLCAVAQAESMRYKLLGGLAVRRACYGVLRFVMESGEPSCLASSFESVASTRVSHATV